MGHPQPSQGGMFLVATATVRARYPKFLRVVMRGKRVTCHEASACTKRLRVDLAQGLSREKDNGRPHIILHAYVPVSIAYPSSVV